MQRTIIILGGGAGGVVAATRLRERLPKAHRVILIEREARHLFAPSLLWLMTGAREAEAISRPLDRLARRGIVLIRGEITAIDPAARRVTVGERTLEGDRLVIALGAELAPEIVPGLAAAGHDFYTLAGAEKLRDAFASFGAGRLALLTAAPVYKCPAAPYEAAMLLEADLRRRGVRDRVKIDFYAAEPGPMGVAGPAVSAAVRAMVEARGIAYHPEHQVVSVDAEKRALSFANGAAAEFDLLVHVPPHRAPRVVREAGLTNESGWIAADRSTLATAHPGVYALGDVVSLPLKLGKPLPKAGVFAHREAEVVARNLAREITGRGAPAAFDGHGECFIETGDGRAGLGRGDFFAEPAPEVKLRGVGRRWHWAKIGFEKYWLWRWF